MPRTRKQASIIATRLSPTDQERFRELVKAQNKPQADVLRDAVRHYLDYCDGQNVDRQNSALERRMKRMEDRLASLLARLGMDIGIVYSFLWHQSNPESRRELFNRCYKDSRDRLAGKLDVIEQDFVDLVKEKVLAEEKTGIKPVE